MGLAHGAICKECPGEAKCRPGPSAVPRGEMDCPACGGAGCPDCDGSGKFEVTGCPKKSLTSATGELIMLAELFEKGLPPVAGGTLDQARSFVTAARYIWGLQAGYKARSFGS